MKILIFNFNNVLTEVAKELEKQGHQVTCVVSKANIKGWQKFERIVVWNETEHSGFRGFVKMAQKAGKKVILVQHGRRGTSRIYPPFNEELISDVVCCWGENDKKRLMSVGVPSEKIRVTGTPIIKDLTVREKHEGKVVLFCPEHWGVEVPENMIVAGQLRRLKNVKIITKLLSGEHRYNYDNPVYSDRAKDEHLQITKDTVAKADVVVGISESTLELIAEAMDIPVVIAKIWQAKPGADGDERYREYKREYSDACDKVENIFKLNERIEYALKHPEFLRKERYQIAIDDGGVNFINPTQEIINVILEK